MFIEKAFKEWCEIRQNIWTWRATCWYPSMNGKSGKRSTERQDLESPAGSAHFTLACVRRDQDDLALVMVTVWGKLKVSNLIFLLLRTRQSLEAVSFRCASLGVETTYILNLVRPLTFQPKKKIWILPQRGEYKTSQKLWRMHFTIC